MIPITFNISIWGRFLTEMSRKERGRRLWSGYTEYHCNDSERRNQANDVFKDQVERIFLQGKQQDRVEKNRRFVSEGICLDIQGVADSKILKAGFTPIAFGWCMSKRHLPLQFCDFFWKENLLHRYHLYLGRVQSFQRKKEGCLWKNI